MSYNDEIGNVYPLNITNTLQCLHGLLNNVLQRGNQADDCNTAHSNQFVMFKPKYILNVFSLCSATWCKKKKKMNTFLIIVSSFASENRRDVLRFHFILWGYFYSFHSIPSQYTALKRKLIHHTTQRACRRQFIGLPDHVMCTIRVYSLKDD